MTETIPVFVNATAVAVPRGTNVRDAIAAADPTLADRLASGAASVTDARGLQVTPDAEVTAGTILRVIVSARRGAAEAAEAGE